MRYVGRSPRGATWARIDWYAVVGLLCVALSGLISLYLVAHIVAVGWAYLEARP